MGYLECNIVCSYNRVNAAYTSASRMLAFVSGVNYILIELGKLFSAEAVVASAFYVVPFAC